MGTTLTGTTPQDTYDSLIKVTDNGPLSGTAKYLSDGLGNDSALALSTSAVGVSETSPLGKLHVKTADTGVSSVSAQGNLLVLEDTENGLSILSSTAGAGYILFGDSADNDVAGIIYDHSANAMIFNTNAAERLRITSAGNVGIGTSAPSVKTEISGSASGDFAALALTNTNQAGTADAATLSFKLGRSVDSLLFTVPAIKFVKEQQWTSSGPTVDGALAFSTISNEATTEQARITSGGVLQLTQGQIKFPATQVASADPNTLDDYEEGTFTMTATPSVSGTITLSPNTARYTKIGRQVSVQAFVTVSAVASPVGTRISIGGLPFALANAAAAGCGAIVTFSDASSSYARTALGSIALQNLTTIIADIDASTIASSDEFFVNITYTV